MRPKYLKRCAAALLLGFTAVVGGIDRAQAGNGYSGPQGDTWASIARLPDWSGTFALDLAGHLASGRAAQNGTDIDGKATALAVPLTPKYFNLRSHDSEDGKQPDLASCLPAGVPGVMLHTIEMEFLFTPGRVTMLFEEGEVRRIFTDRTTHLPLDDLDSSYEGDSIGHWEGNTLVVDTIGFPKGALFQNGSLPATINSHYVERIFMRDHDHIEIDAALTNPAIFYKPYTTKLTYERQPDVMGEPACAQTAREHGNDIDLTPPTD